MLHRVLLGSIERFLGILIEHYAGAFPTWLAPVQAIVVTVTDRHIPHGEKVYRSLLEAGIRVEKDVRNEKLSYKIREAQLQKSALHACHRRPGGGRRRDFAATARREGSWPHGARSLHRPDPGGERRHLSHAPSSIVTGDEAKILQTH